MRFALLIEGRRSAFESVTLARIVEIRNALARTGAFGALVIVRVYDVEIAATLVDIDEVVGG